MSKYSNTAVYSIITYLWAQLQAEDVLDVDDYYVASYDLSVMPIVPVQEVPELSNHLGDKAYMVYDTLTTSKFDDNWWVNRDEVVITIFSQDVAKINEIKNLVVDKFTKMDKSAQELNAWLNATDAADYYFNCLELISASISGETDMEYGRTTGEIIISADYMRNLDADGNYS